MDTESAFNSIEHDIKTRLEKFIKSGRIATRVSEMNPLRLASVEQLDEKAKADELFARYLQTWDNDLVTRMTIVDENVETEEEVLEENPTFEEMPPKDFILRYYVREYEDGIEIPPSAEPSLILTPNSVH